MSENKRWQFDIEEYIRQGEPETIEKSKAWQIAIGLQQVDGLQTSEYLLDTAKEHIEGKITIDEAQKRIHNYYEALGERKDVEIATREADIVSSRITEILGENTFQFSPAEWKNIHRRLFKDVLQNAGEIRDFNISKNEWVLKGDTVIYAAWNSIEETLKYDFSVEEEFSYEGLSTNEIIKHIAKFTSNIWQIHPFAEGNTRATAVFIIKYLKTFGFEVNNDAFEKYSWYFRNALVRANYNNFKKNVHETTRYLEMFFSNLLTDTEYELKNRYLHLDFTEQNQIKENEFTDYETSKGKNCTLDCTLEEIHILKLMKNNPSITQKEIGNIIGKSERTIKNRVASLREKKYVERINGKRDGKWIVLVEEIN